jgi:hypothetical protein
MDWEQHAVAYFFSNYVCAPVAHGSGHLDYLPETFTRDAHVGYFRDSLMAVALSSIANVSVIVSLQHRAAQLYGQALRSINHMLRGACDEKEYELLMLSIFLLQKYEVCRMHIQKRKRKRKKWEEREDQNVVFSC